MFQLIRPLVSPMNFCGVETIPPVRLLEPCRFVPTLSFSQSLPMSQYAATTSALLQPRSTKLQLSRKQTGIKVQLSRKQTSTKMQPSRKQASTKMQPNKTETSHRCMVARQIMKTLVFCAISQGGKGFCANVKSNSDLAQRRTSVAQPMGEQE